MATGAMIDEPTSQPLVSAVQSFSKQISLVVILIGAAVIVGWMFHIDLFKSVLPSSVAMKINTALGLIFSAISLRLWHQQPPRRWTRQLSQTSAIVVLGIGLLTLIQYAFTVDLGIDQLWIKTPLDPIGDAAPGRMAVHTAFCFLLLGIDLLLLNVRRVRALPAQILAIVIFLIALLGILGYVFGNAVFYRIGSPTSMAIHTSIAFLLLSLGVLFARPRSGLVAIFVRTDAGGMLARRLIPCAILIPPLVCWLLLLGARSQIYTLELGICLLSLFVLILFTLIISIHAQSLSRFDQQNQQAQRMLQHSNQALEERVNQRTSQLQKTNHQLQTEIDQRQQIEQELRESEELKQRILESSQDCIKVLTLSSEIVYISPGGLRLLEIDDPSTILNTNWVERWQGENREKATAAIAAAIRGDSGQFQGYLATDKGNPKWWDSLITPVRDASGRVVQLLAVSRDITKAKQSEVDREQLLQREQAAREQAETANRIKDEFLAVLSHELRTPLNPILGWSKLLQSRKLDDERTAQALGTIERNARLQSQLIEDLLDVSRILRGKLTLNIAPVDLKTVLQSAIETVRLAAEAKNIELEADFDSNINAVSGDASRLQQVAWNLLSNAVKFTPDGGWVGVRLAQVERCAQIQVTDTGRGISPDFLPFVFERFRQEDGATTRKFGGLGLGLAIVCQIVELHGGTVQADSAGEGQGATFTVCLPTIQNSSSIDTSVVAGTSSRDALAGLRALVVDDDTDARELVQFVLEEEGAIVTGVASAFAALDLLRQSQFDLLISDIGMPDLDGYMLMEQIRAQQSGHNSLPAIALTAYAGDLNQRKARAAGFVQHLSKPLDPEALLTAVITLVRGF